MLLSTMKDNIRLQPSRSRTGLPKNGVLVDITHFVQKRWCHRVSHKLLVAFGPRIRCRHCYQALWHDGSDSGRRPGATVKLSGASRNYVHGLAEVGKYDTGPCKWG